MIVSETVSVHLTDASGLFIDTLGIFTDKDRLFLFVATETSGAKSSQLHSHPDWKAVGITGSDLPVASARGAVPRRDPCHPIEIHTILFVLR